MEATVVASRAEEATSQAEASREAVLTEVASAEALEALTAADLEGAEVDSVAEIDTTSKTTMCLRSLTTTLSK